MDDLTKIWNFDLKRGNSNDPGNGACLMDAISWFEYGTLGDHPECTCDVIAAYCRNINDAMTDAGRQKLKMFIPRLIGTKDEAARKERAEYLVWQAIRVFTPFWIGKAGMKNEAEQLRGFSGDFTQARILLKSIEKDAAAASAAAYAAYAYAAANAAANAASAAYAYAAYAYAAYAAASAYAAANAAANAANAAANAAYAAANAASAAYAYVSVSVSASEWEPLMLAALDGVLKIGKQAEPIEDDVIMRANDTFRCAREMA